MTGNEVIEGNWEKKSNVFFSHWISTIIRKKVGFMLILMLWNLCLIGLVEAFNACEINRVA